MTKEELLKSKEYWYENFAVEVFNLLVEKMRLNSHSVNGIAKRTGLSVKKINAILVDANMEKLAMREFFT